MGRISREEVDHVANLARLSLGDEERQALQRDLDAILTHAESLQAIDTEGVEATAHVIPLATPLRDDVPEAAMDPELAVANAPEASGSAFVVPAVIAGEEEG